MANDNDQNTRTFTKEEQKILRHLHRLGIKHEWQIRQFFLGLKIAHDALLGKEHGEK